MSDRTSPRPDNSLAEIGALLLRSGRILIASHYNPDTDALGSSCALMHELRALGKEAVCINESRIVEAHKFLPGVADVVNEVPAGNFDCLVVCDCGELKRTGDRLSLELAKIPVIVNLDHHVTNDHFGQYNFVKTTAAATSEIVYELLQEMKAGPGVAAATCLYAGLSGDTGSFRYTNTNIHTFEVARALVEHGANPSLIADGLHGRKPLCQVRLEAVALSNIEMHFGGKLSWVSITQEMYDACQATQEHTENIVDFARDISGVRVAVAAKRDGEIWRVSLRGKADEVNLSEVAAAFGGGGHRCAAAFRWRKPLDELKSSLLARLSQETSLK